MMVKKKNFTLAVATAELPIKFKSFYCVLCANALAITVTTITIKFSRTSGD